MQGILLQQSNVTAYPDMFSWTGLIVALCLPGVWLMKRRTRRRTCCTCRLRVAGGTRAAGAERHSAWLQPAPIDEQRRDYVRRHYDRDRLDLRLYD